MGSSRDGTAWARFGEMTGNIKETRDKAILCANINGVCSFNGSMKQESGGPISGLSESQRNCQNFKGGAISWVEHGDLTVLCEHKGLEKWFWVCCCQCSSEGRVFAQEFSMCKVLATIACTTKKDSGTKKTRTICL